MTIQISLNQLNEAYRQAEKVLLHIQSAEESYKEINNLAKELNIKIDLPKLNLEPLEGNMSEFKGLVDKHNANVNYLNLTTQQEAFMLTLESMKKHSTEDEILREFKRLFL